MRRSGRVLAALTLVAVLAACGGDAGSPEPTPDAPPPSEPGPTRESDLRDEPVATVTIPAEGAELDVAVHPLVRAGEHVVLTLDATPTSAGGEGIRLWNVFRRVNTSILPVESPLPVRLLDLERGVIMHAGTDADEDPVVAPREWDLVEGEAGTRLQLAFAAPPADVTSLSLLVPGAPFVEAVPIVDGDVPPATRPGTPRTGPDDEPQVLDLDAIATARVFPLESTSRELAGAVQTTESTEMIEVVLGSDVLFAFDSAELTEQSDDAVALVAERINARRPGPVSVVGHTDDQGDAAYNQELSERRAQAVADAFAARVDTAAYPLAVEGKGMSEPVVENRSEEDRARNRRVTVGLTTPVVTQTETTTGGELPPWEGPTGEAGAPLRLDETPGGVWDVDATARRVHGHVVLDLAVTAVEDGYTSFLRSLGSHRGVGTTAPHSSAAGLTVLHGATRLHPLDYRTGESATWPEGEWLTAADLVADVSYAAEQTFVFTYVYPRLDVDTVTVQLGSTGRHRNDFRITDVPVQD